MPRASSQTKSISATRSFLMKLKEHGYIDDMKLPPAHSFEGEEAVEGLPFSPDIFAQAILHQPSEDQNEQLMTNIRRWVHMDYLNFVRSLLAKLQQLSEKATLTTVELIRDRLLISTLMGGALSMGEEGYITQRAPAIAEQDDIPEPDTMAEPLKQQ